MIRTTNWTLFQSFRSTGRGTITDQHGFTALARTGRKHHACPASVSLESSFLVEKTRTSSKHNSKHWSLTSWALQRVTVHGCWPRRFPVWGLASLAVVIMRGASLFKPSVSGPAGLFQSLLWCAWGHSRLISVPKSVHDFQDFSSEWQISLIPRKMHELWIPPRRWWSKHFPVYFVLTNMKLKWVFKTTENKNEEENESQPFWSKFTQYTLLAWGIR